jgi:hypothetical protein
VIARGCRGGSYQS